jgi:hypothetical protein
MDVQALVAQTAVKRGEPTLRVWRGHSVFVRKSGSSLRLDRAGTAGHARLPQHTTRGSTSRLRRDLLLLIGLARELN